MTSVQKTIFFLFIFIWLLAAWDPAFRQTWFMENIPILIFIPIVIILGRVVGLSTVSYGLIALFLVFHIIGAHYTYEKVPLGFTIGEWLGYDRNMYDRLVHLMFGVLVTYPSFEFFKKASKISLYWGYFFTFCFIMMFASGYEIIEWITSVSSNPQASMAYLGAQGDIWDTQKDMIIASIGSSAVILVLLLTQLRRKLPSKAL